MPTPTGLTEERLREIAECLAGSRRSTASESGVIAHELLALRADLALHKEVMLTIRAAAGLEVGDGVSLVQHVAALRARLREVEQERDEWRWECGCVSYRSGRMKERCAHHEGASVMTPAHGDELVPAEWAARYQARAEQAEADRDAARAEVAALRKAIEILGVPHPNDWTALNRLRRARCGDWPPQPTCEECQSDEARLTWLNEFIKGANKPAAPPSPPPANPLRISPADWEAIRKLVEAHPLPWRIDMPEPDYAVVVDAAGRRVPCFSQLVDDAFRASDSRNQPALRVAEALLSALPAVQALLERTRTPSGAAGQPTREGE